MDYMIYSTGVPREDNGDLPVIVLSLGDIATASAASDTKDERLFEKLYERWSEVYSDCDAAARGYVLVILSVDDGGAGNGLPSRVNRFGWLMWKLRNVDYEYRKNVKKINIVYPSWLTRVFMPLFLPMVSSKAYAKIQYTRSLRSLSRIYGVSLAGIRLSIPLLHVEAKALQEVDGDRRHGPRPPSLIGGVTSMVGKMWSVVPFLPRWDDEPESHTLLGNDKRSPFGNLDDFISPEPAPIPRILTELRDAILSEPCNQTEGIFRRSSHSPLSHVLSHLLALPDKARPAIPWRDLAIEDRLLPPAKLQGILSGFSNPIISTQLYPAIRKTSTVPDLESHIIPSLSPSDHRILSFLAQLILDLVPFEPSTRMSAKALAICFAPALIAGQDQIQDAAMCLAPGQKLPLAMTQGHDMLEGDGTIVGMLMLWAEYQHKTG